MLHFYFQKKIGLGCAKVIKGLAIFQIHLLVFGASASLLLSQQNKIMASINVPLTPSPPRQGCDSSIGPRGLKKASSKESKKRDSSLEVDKCYDEQPKSDVTKEVVDEATSEARRVINEEMQGLLQLREMVNESFCHAAAMLHAIPGRIIVTGLGKSGHIGRKIASTLASTGSPAFFLHPGDFNHGELGAINRGDGMIMLSRSGDVPELYQTIARCHRLEIPLISITAKASSKLARDSNVAVHFLLNFFLLSPTLMYFFSSAFNSRHSRSLSTWIGSNDVSSGHVGSWRCFGHVHDETA